MAVTVIVPGTVDVKTPIAPDRLKAVLAEAEKVLGGKSRQATGGWVSAEHGLVDEPVYPVTGEADPTAAHAFARKIARDLGQEAVMVIEGSRAHFLAPDPAGDYPTAERKVTIHVPPGADPLKVREAKHQLSEWFGGFTHETEGGERLVSHATEEAAKHRGQHAAVLAKSLGGTAQYD